VLAGHDLSNKLASHGQKPEALIKGRYATSRVALVGKLYALARLKTDIDGFANVDTKAGTTRDRLSRPTWKRRPGNYSTSGQKGVH